jgi:hypothetical protein
MNIKVKVYVNVENQVWTLIFNGWNKVVFDVKDLVYNRICFEVYDQVLQNIKEVEV